MKRNIYLENVPLTEALDRWLSLCGEEGVEFPLASEAVPVARAAGRVTAEPVFARVSSPPFHSSAMDGVAARAEDTHAASEATPGRLRMGVDIVSIDTGEPVPRGFDAVIMIEDLNEVAEGVFEITKPAAPWQHIRPLGEDLVATELIVPRSHRIRPVDIGALLNAGLTRIEVRRKPVIAIVPTGTELVESPEEMCKGKVMESNSWTLAAFLEGLGADVIRMDLIPDDYDTIRDSVEDALGRADAVVVNAGTSAGTEDYTSSIVGELGKVAVHGVAIKPGKPTVLGVARSRPILGLPGFPVACYRAAEEFLKPLVMEFLGLPLRSDEIVRARLVRKVFSAPGFDEFVQVKLGRVKGEVIAVPLPRGSGVSMSLVRSDGVVRIPARTEGLGAREEVEVSLYEGDLNLDGTILAVGSHDVSLDLLASRIKFTDPGLSLASANVGSMGGIIAVSRGQAHLAGTHLLDPETGDFNVPYILEHTSPDEVFLIHLAWRTQGLMVPRGNPKGISGVEDLGRDDVSFINRQKGSGTRLLLDHMLGEAGMDPGDVQGYERETFTHTAVAAAIAGGTADAGLGVLAAARALDIEFIPVARERYDLLALKSFEGTPGYEAIVEALGDDDYRLEVEALGGYDLSSAGEIIPLEGK